MTTLKIGDKVRITAMYRGQRGLRGTVTDVHRFGVSVAIDSLQTTVIFEEKSVKKIIRETVKGEQS